MSRENHEREADREPLEAIERTLAALEPAPPRIDRDRLMFLAGQAAEGSGFRVQRSGVGGRKSGVGISPGRSSWLWPASTAALAATSLALAIALLMRPAPRVEIVYRDRPVESLPGGAAESVDKRDESSMRPAAVAHVPTPAHALPPRRTLRIPDDNYLRARDVALRMGLDALGSPRRAGSGTSSPTYLELLETMVPVPAAEPIEESAPNL